jgi:hypothetical protein
LSGTCWERAWAWASMLPSLWPAVEIRHAKIKMKYHVKEAGSRDASRANSGRLDFKASFNLYRVRASKAAPTLDRKAYQLHYYYRHHDCPFIRDDVCSAHDLPGMRSRHRGVTAPARRSVPHCRCVGQPLTGIGIDKVTANLEDQLVSVQGTAAPSAIVAALQASGRDAILRGSGKSDSEYAQPIKCSRSLTCSCHDYHLQDYHLQDYHLQDCRLQDHHSTI